MTVYLISYELSNPSQDYSKLFEAINSLGSCMQSLNSTWLVDSALTGKEIFDVLKPLFDEQDQLLVIEVKKSWHSFMPQKCFIGQPSNTLTPTG